LQRKIGIYPAIGNGHEKMDTDSLIAPGAEEA